MTRPSPRLRTSLLLVFVCNAALALGVPITVYPSPIQFGADASKPISSGYPMVVYMSNSSANSVNVNSVTVSGSSSSQFAFYGQNCVGVISAGQDCQMYMTFTPAAAGEPVCEKGGRYFSFSRTKHLAGEVFKEVNKVVKDLRQRI